MALALLKGLPDKAVIRISSGSQTYLFLRLRPHKEFCRVILFSQGAVPAATMELIPGELHSHSRADLTQLFMRYSGMSYPEWNHFWFGTQSGYALEIVTFAAIPESLRFNVVDYFRLKQTPQNFVYVPAPSWALGRPNTHPQPKEGNLF